MATHIIYTLALLLTFFYFVENEVYISGPHILLEGRELRISCNSTEYLDQVPRWYKDREEVSTLPDFGDRIKNQTLGSKEWQLVFSRARPSDVGNYSCVHNNLNATTRVRTIPILYQFEEFQKTNYKSANIVEGERFSLRCALAKGYERDAHLQWYMYREEDASSDHLAAHLLTINTSDARISIESNDSSTSVLTISEVGPQDRFFYVCKSHNDVTSYNNTILLRVKDKLAALWPFLGIVCEVLILIIVIFVYEKRRVKPDFDDTPTTNHRKNEGKGSPQDSSSRSQDVRQRK